MTSKLDNESATASERATARAYSREFWPAMVGYAVVLVATLTWGHLDGDSPLRFVWALAPVIPAVWIVRAVFRQVHRVDEYQRLLLLKSLAVGFAVAMLAAITLGFLANAGLRFTDAPWLMLAAGMLGWAVTGICVGRR
jgi:glucose-6-phosphate-specific signal transduction histidine kinase